MTASATFLSVRKMSRPMRFPARPMSVLPVASTATTKGSWRYSAPKSSSLVNVAAYVIAAGLHVVALLAFNGNSSHPAKVAPRAPMSVIQMELPPIPPEDPIEKVEELQDSSSAAAPIPQLADRPSIAPNPDFTQPMDYQPTIDIDPSAMKQMTIPTHFGRGAVGAGSSVFDVSQLDRAPVATAQPSPQFPAQLKNTVTEARVTVNFVVDSTGRVINANVVDSTNFGFHEAALDGVRRWKFRPGMKAGRKVATNMLVTIRFNVMDS